MGLPVSKIQQIKKFLIRKINWIIFLFAGTYISCMFVVPVITSGLDWSYVQSVWYRWQSLNVGVLAFLASFLALNISICNNRKQRGQKFIAARSFLPDALSELTSYLERCSPLLKEAWSRACSETVLKKPFESSLPDLPPNHREIFSRCIEFSDSNIGEYLANILRLLQIHHSRLEDLKNLEDRYHKPNRSKNYRKMIISFLFSFGELRALINRIFDFARGMESLDNRPLKLNEMISAYSGLSITPKDYEGLEQVIKEKVELGVAGRNWNDQISPVQA